MRPPCNQHISPKGLQQRPPRRPLSVSMCSSCQQVDQNRDAGDVRFGQQWQSPPSKHWLRFQHANISRPVLFFSASCLDPCSLVAANHKWRFSRKRRPELGYIQHLSSKTPTGNLQRLCSWEENAALSPLFPILIKSFIYTCCVLTFRGHLP
jgi:hypothetical protein